MCSVLINLANTLAGVLFDIVKKMTIQNLYSYWIKTRELALQGSSFLDLESALKTVYPDAPTLKACEKDTIDDVVGMEEAKKAIEETINDRVIFEELYKAAPIKISTSNLFMFLLIDIMLYGCSGSGKTYLGNLIAKSMGLNQITVKGPELLNKYIGASEEAVRKVFERA